MATGVSPAAGAPCSPPGGFSMAQMHRFDRSWGRQEVFLMGTSDGKHVLTEPPAASALMAGGGALLPGRFARSPGRVPARVPGCGCLYRGRRVLHSERAPC